MQQNHTGIFYNPTEVDSKGLFSFVTCSIHYSYYSILGRIMGMMAWGQDLQDVFWQSHSSERAEPHTKQPGPAGPQPTLHHSVLTVVPRSLGNGLMPHLLPICTNPHMRNFRACTGIAQLALLAGMPRAQHPHSSVLRAMLAFCVSSICKTTPFHQCSSTEQ